MTQALGQMLPFAIVVALSPIPIVAVIAMLFSARAIANGLSFLVGWVLGVAGGLALLTLAAGTQDLGSDGQPSGLATSLRAILGLLLLIAAVRTWRGRPAPGEEVPMPRWMTRVEGVTAARALVLGLLLGGVNPKNLLMNAAAAAVLAASGLPWSEAVGAIAGYTLVASSTVAFAIGYRVVRGDAGAATLERVRGWLATHNDAIVAVLFLVFGVKLLADALTGM